MVVSKLILLFDPEKLEVNKVITTKDYQILKRPSGEIAIYLVDNPKITEMP